MRTMYLCLAALLLAGCTYAVDDIAQIPAQPTYERDVKYFLADHCVLCHGSPPGRGAPATFRLDVYADPAGKVPGAAAEAGRILDQIQRGRMPPGGGVGSNAIQMLSNWLQGGAPER